VVRKLAAWRGRGNLRYCPGRGHRVIDGETDEAVSAIAGWLLLYEQGAARELPMRA